MCVRTGETAEDAIRGEVESLCWGWWELVDDEIILIGGRAEGFLKPVWVDVPEGVQVRECIVGLVDAMEDEFIGEVVVEADGT